MFLKSGLVWTKNVLVMQKFRWSNTTNRDDESRQPVDHGISMKITQVTKRKKKERKRNEKGKGLLDYNECKFMSPAQVLLGDLVAASTLDMEIKNF